MAKHRSDLKQREQIYRAILVNACDAWGPHTLHSGGPGGLGTDADVVKWFFEWRAQTRETLRVLRRRGEP